MNTLKNFATLCILVVSVCITNCAENEPKSSLVSNNDRIAKATPRPRMAKELIDSLKQHILKSGYLVMRTGNDVTSDAIKNFSQTDKSYSHAGVCIKEADTFFIYHVNVDDSNPKGKMKKEPVDSFLNPKNNIGFGIYRYNMSDTVNAQFITQLVTYFKKGIVFDMMFDYRSDDKLYCAELISKSLYNASKGLIEIPKTKVTLEKIPKKYLALFPHMQPVIDRYAKTGLYFIALDNLYLNTHCRFVMKEMY